MKTTFLARTAADLRSRRWHPELKVSRSRNDSIDKVGTPFACLLLAGMLAGPASAAAPAGTPPATVAPENASSSRAAVPKPETGNATYVGLSVNDASLLKGVLNVDHTKLKGSADSYHSEVPNPASLEKFFVHFFTGDCAAIADLTDGACTTITPDMIPLSTDETAPGDAKLHGMFSMAVRAYVKPDSERGPDPTKQLPPHTLTFFNE